MLSSFHCSSFALFLCLCSFPSFPFLRFVLRFSSFNSITTEERKKGKEERHEFLFWFYFSFYSSFLFNGLSEEKEARKEWRKKREINTKRTNLISFSFPSFALLIVMKEKKHELKGQRREETNTIPFLCFISYLFRSFHASISFHCKRTKQKRNGTKKERRRKGKWWIVFFSFNYKRIKKSARIKWKENTISSFFFPFPSSFVPHSSLTYNKIMWWIEWKWKKDKRNKCVLSSFRSLHHTNAHSTCLAFSSVTKVKMFRSFSFYTALSLFFCSFLASFLSFLSPLHWKWAKRTKQINRVNENSPRSFVHSISLPSLLIPFAR